MKKIKLYVDYNYYNNVHFYKYFDIIDHIPVVGEEFHLNENIVEVRELYLDCEQANEKAYTYKAFEITLRPTDQWFDEDDEPDAYDSIKYVAYCDDEANEEE